MIWRPTAPVLDHVEALTLTLTHPSLPQLRPYMAWKEPLVGEKLKNEPRDPNGPSTSRFPRVDKVRWPRLRRVDSQAVIVHEVCDLIGQTCDPKGH